MTVGKAIGYAEVSIKQNNNAMNIKRFSQIGLEEGVCCWVTLIFMCFKVCLILVGFRRSNNDKYNL